MVFNSFPLTPKFLIFSHKYFLDIESNAFLKSSKQAKVSKPCFTQASTSVLIVNRWSAQLQDGLNPHCSSTNRLLLSKYVPILQLIIWKGSLSEPHLALKSPQIKRFPRF